MSAGGVDRHAVGFPDFHIDVFLEGQTNKYSQLLYLIDCIAHIIYGTTIKYSRKYAENPFPNILA
jgi:hypothetical protein